jgi:23S rRNA pseudouridine1911/1915/1917 synthase
MVVPPKPEVKTIQITEAAIRLDKYLAKVYTDLSRSYIQKLIEQGYIMVNGYGAKVSQKLNTGDKISFSLPHPEPISLAAEPIPLNIVYEDNDLVVLNKPAGLTVHPAPGHTSHTLVNAMLAHCPDLAKFGDSLRPGIVHRLDKDTSGLMIIAKNSPAQQNLINQFKTRSVSKGYLVLVKGKLTPTRGIIEAPIGRHPANRKLMAVVTSGRQARTGYRVKEYLDNYTLLEVTLETGRTHQIRVHLSAIGYPVVGDPVYGVKSAHLKRQFVHAYRLGFHIPSSREFKEFTCELPQDLKQALELIKQH